MKQVCIYYPVLPGDDEHYLKQCLQSCFDNNEVPVILPHILGVSLSEKYDKYIADIAIYFIERSEKLIIFSDWGIDDNCKGLISSAKQLGVKVEKRLVIINKERNKEAFLNCVIQAGYRSFCEHFTAKLEDQTNGFKLTIDCHQLHVEHLLSLDVFDSIPKMKAQVDLFSRELNKKALALSVNDKTKHN